MKFINLTWSSIGWQCPVRFFHFLGCNASNGNLWNINLTGYTLAHEILENFQEIQADFFNLEYKYRQYIEFVSIEKINNHILQSHAAEYSPFGKLDALSSKQNFAFLVS